MTRAHDGPLFAACIPSRDRPQAVQDLLTNLLEQELRFDVVLVVDSSSTEQTRAVVEELSSSFGDDVLRYERSAPGLPRQRRRGIESLRQISNLGYITFLDDDVLLDPPFLAVIARFLESEPGRPYGAIGGYDRAGWGRQGFSRLERAYHRIGVFDGELRPGRWLYCGYFLEFEALADQPRDVYDCEFLPGPFNVWRAEVFDHFLPPIDMSGYALGEDKHLSLRARTRYRLGVHRNATAQHLHVAGGRPKRLKMAFTQVRMTALLIRDCDPARSGTRYLAMLGFYLIHCVVQSVWRIGKGQFTDLPSTGASVIGLLSCVVAPPRRTSDALQKER